MSEQGLMNMLNFAKKVCAGVKMAIHGREFRIEILGAK
jgi:hypothetical protein